MRPEILALRATNQYRSRDIIAYLGLRYYFANLCARRDRWAEDVSSFIVQTRNSPAYFRSAHFKEISETGQIGYREIFLPDPNEIFAETALLSECAKNSAFKSLPCVFSYRLTTGNDGRGVFSPYFDGFRERHMNIKTACERDPSSIVLYTDIKKFYPSISPEIALVAWNKACEQSNLPDKWSELGRKLLSDYLKVAKDGNAGNGILTGPMFSHLIANLVMNEIDYFMLQQFPGCYFRYVDDIVIVGTKSQVVLGRKNLTSQLEKINLFLHDQDQGKDFEVNAEDWLQGARDFESIDGRQWARFIGGLKQYIGTQPEAGTALTESLALAGFRVPIPSYALMTQEGPWLMRLRGYLYKFRWLPSKLRGISASHILRTACLLRDSYARSLRQLLELDPGISGYMRKRAIPKMRFYAGRLLYLGTFEMLHEFSLTLHRFNELHMLAVIMNAVATRDVTELLSLGSNATQSAAQLLCLSDKAVICHLQDWNYVNLQGLAILRLNGITIDGPIDDPLNQFACWTSESSKLMQSDVNSAIRELACLHGVATTARHAGTLSSVFDWDEELAFDVINQVRESGY